MGVPGPRPGDPDGYSLEERLILFAFLVPAALVLVSLTATALLLSKDWRLRARIRCRKRKPGRRGSGLLCWRCWWWCFWG